MLRAVFAASVDGDALAWGAAVAAPLPFGSAWAHAASGVARRFPAASPPTNRRLFKVESFRPWPGR